MIDFDSDSPGGDDESCSGDEVGSGGCVGDDNNEDNELMPTSERAETMSSSNLTDLHSIPTLSTNSYQEIKHSTMWIGNDDGRWDYLFSTPENLTQYIIYSFSFSLHVFQFNDSAVRTVARKNRITKQFTSGIDSIAYIFIYISNLTQEIVLG